MIHHHVFFWLKEPANRAHIDQLKQGLETLRTVPEIQELFIGEPAGTESRDVVDHSYQVSELMFFSSLTDQATYQSHPIHQQFIQNHQHLWQKVVVYDVNV